MSNSNLNISYGPEPNSGSTSKQILTVHTKLRTVGIPYPEAKPAEELSNSTVRRNQQLTIVSKIVRQPQLDISSSSQRNQQQPSDVVFSEEHQNDAASTNKNDTSSHQQLTTDSLQNNQQLVALNNSKRRRTGHVIIASNSWSQSVTPKMLRFNLSKRRRIAPTTGSSN
ncbi:hypothetical protein F511_38713 [Dorcoceras hygrometricum]|uniref:Uncharacterized protein n=1 Tax=Dorcoceras hygrometricum TaxID=472368 RepID=A0A2Z7CIR5_9LAMI|nr:hypothetical protein F511_38713 [Dorcoceras hygrometricum]